MDIKRRIFGLSDSASFFVTDTAEPVLAKKLVELSCKNTPVICYIGAAKGDRADRISEFRALTKRIGAQAKVLSLYDPPSEDASTYFDNTDIIFIDGGSTRNLLALFHEWNVVEPMTAAYQSGVILSGASAGLNIMFNWCITDSVKTDLKELPGLGILEGSISVHHNAHPDRPQIFERLLQSGKNVFPAFAIDDGVAALFENEKVSETVSINGHSGFHEFHNTEKPAGKPAGYAG